MKRTEKKPSFHDWIRGWAGLLMCSLVFAPPSAYALKTQELHEAAGLEELEQQLTAQLEEKVGLAETGLEEVTVLEISMKQFLEGREVRNLQEVDRGLLLEWLKQKITGAPAGQQRVVRIQPQTAEEVRFWLGLQLGFQSVWNLEQVRERMSLEEFPRSRLRSMGLVLDEGPVFRRERVSLEISDPNRPLSRILFFPALWEMETFTVGMPESFRDRLDQLAKPGMVSDDLRLVLLGQLVEQVEAGSVVATPLILPEEKAKEQFAQAVGLPPVKILSEEAALKKWEEQHKKERQGTVSQKKKTSEIRRGRKKKGTPPLSARQHLEQDPDFERMLKEYPELLAPAGQDRRDWYLERLSRYNVSGDAGNGWNPTRVIAFLENVRNVQKRIQSRLPGYPGIAGVLMIADKIKLPQFFIIHGSEPPQMVLQIDLTDPGSSGALLEKVNVASPFLLRIYGEGLLQMDPGIQAHLRPSGQPPVSITLEEELERWSDPEERKDAQRETRILKDGAGLSILQGGLRNHRWFYSGAPFKSLGEEPRDPLLRAEVGFFIGASLVETISLRTMFLLTPEAVLRDDRFWIQAFQKQVELLELEKIKQKLPKEGWSAENVSVLEDRYYTSLKTLWKLAAFLAAAPASMRGMRGGSADTLQALDKQLIVLDSLLKELAKLIRRTQEAIVTKRPRKGGEKIFILDWPGIYESQLVQLKRLADSLKFRGEMGQTPGSAVIMVSPQAGLEEAVSDPAAVARDLAVEMLGKVYDPIWVPNGSPILIFTDPESFDLVPLAIRWSRTVGVDYDGPEAEALRELVRRLPPPQGAYAIGKQATRLLLKEHEGSPIIQVANRREALHHLGLDADDLPPVVREAIKVTGDYLRDYLGQSV